VGAFDAAIEAGRAGGDEAVLGLKAFTHGGEGMIFDGAV